MREPRFRNEEADEPVRNEAKNYWLNLVSDKFGLFGISYRRDPFGRLDLIFVEKRGSMFDLWELSSLQSFSVVVVQ